jgi:hypothetical protein
MYLNSVVAFDFHEKVAAKKGTSEMLWYLLEDNQGLWYYGIMA